MLLSPMIQRFAEQTPMSVLARMTLENLFGADAIDAVFDAVSERQYTRDLLFSTTTDLLVQVTMFGESSVNAAIRKAREELPVSVAAVYQKLQGVEPAVCEALVSQPAAKAQRLIAEFGPGRPQPVPGYRVQIADGNVLGRSERRVKELRGSSVAALPGLSLALFDPATSLIRALIVCENAHTSERKLIERLVDHLQPNDLLVADRNFAIREFFADLTHKGVAFLIRHHASFKLEFLGQRVQFRGEDNRAISYQKVRLTDGNEYTAIRIDRKKKTKGDRYITLLTSLKVTRKLAQTLVDVYRKRWQIEESFRQLTQYLSCEVKTLGYPKAALLAFSLAVTAYNCLACVKAALASRFGYPKLDLELSMFYLAMEVKQVHVGMRVAVPAEDWSAFARMEPAELAKAMQTIVGHVKMPRYKKSPRGPKKPVSTIRDRHKHQSTAQVIARRKLTTIVP